MAFSLVGADTMYCSSGSYSSMVTFAPAIICKKPVFVSVTSLCLKMVDCALHCCRVLTIAYAFSDETVHLSAFHQDCTGHAVGALSLHCVDMKMLTYKIAANVLGYSCMTVHVPAVHLRHLKNMCYANIMLIYQSDYSAVLELVP
jgi:hypothetical protein